MIGKKINQLATELAPVSTDLTIIGDPDSGVSKKITLAQLGAIFSGAVSFYTNLAAFPVTGDINVIYCAKDTQKLYLWSGSAYVEVFPSQALLDTYQLRSEKGVSNGYASLDSAGKVPISQLPSSIMEYKGTWNASTNTPTLANGTGDTGDVYICNVAGTVNFGAGPITFAVGDYVIYSGTIWQRSSGAVGTVTSVALTVGGDAISVSGSPLTTSGTLALAFSGTSAQYINGAGNLTTFPTSLISGSGASGQVTFFNGANSVTGTNNFFWDSTNNRLGIGTTTPQRSIEIYNTTADNHLRLSGNAPSVSMGEAVTGSIYQAKFGLVTTNGQFVSAGVAGDFVIISQTGATIIGTSSTEKMRVNTSGNVSINNTNNTYKLDVTGTGRYTGQLRLESTITDGTNTYTLPSATGTLALTSQIPSVTGYVPYTGATANLDLGTHTLIAAKGTFSSSGSGDTVGITHSSGSGISLNITKGGSGEGLYINKTSGSGNAATIIGTLNATTLVKSGGTSSQFLKADGSVDSTSYGTGSVTSVGLSSATSGVTIGSTPITTSGTITLAIATASGSQQGLLSSTDWTTFNNKQNALTNPVTGTGTTNYLPKFTGASTIGNSLLTDNGTTLAYGNNIISLGGSNTSEKYLEFGFSNGALYVGGTSSEHYIFGQGDKPLRLYTNGSLKATLTSSGNLGIGTSSPAYRLQVSSTAAEVMRLQGTSGGGSNNTQLRFYGSASAADLWAIGTEVSTGSSGRAFDFYDLVAGANRMRLDASGNLGLGVTPSAWSVVSPVIEFTAGGFIGSQGSVNTIYMGSNHFYNGTNFIYKQNGFATQYQVGSGLGNHQWYVSASGTAGNAISFTQAMTLDASGRLGIGTTSPSSLLHVNSGTSGTQTIANFAAANYGSASSRTYIQIGTQFGDGSSRIGSVNTTGNQSALIFQTQSATSGVWNDAMYINGSGNVGIGTTSPARKLDVNGVTRSTAFDVYYNSVLTGFLLSENQWVGNSSTNLAIAAETGNAITFFTNGSASERMRITSGGLVLFGTTSAPSASVSGFCIEGSSSGNISSSGASTSAYNHLLFYNGNGLVGYISTSGSTTTYSTSSDYRLKQDYKDYSGLELVNKIKTYDYEWKSDKTRGYGVIAHELQSVINYAVTGVKDGKEMQGVDYSKIVPVLIKAIQEQQTQIEQLKNK